MQLQKDGNARAAFSSAHATRAHACAAQFTARAGWRVAYTTDLAFITFYHVHYFKS
ncbi:MAG: hypothetical protein IPI91_17860 [Flavobacteriales bacterium]|nr:hypothetical protein [Flavobacteriales bacterium]